MLSVILVSPVALSSLTEAFARALGLGEEILTVPLGPQSGGITHLAGHVLTEDLRLAALPDSLNGSGVAWLAFGLNPDDLAAVLEGVTIHVTPMIDRFDPCATFLEVSADKGLQVAVS